MADKGPGRINSADNRKTFPCVACLGSGFFQGARVHQTKTRCFSCKGKGFFLTSAHDRAQAKVKSAERKAKQADKRAHEFGAYLESLCEDEAKTFYHWFIDQVATGQADGTNTFFVSLYESGTKYGALTEGQETALLNAFECSRGPAGTAEK